MCFCVGSACECSGREGRKRALEALELSCRWLWAAWRASGNPAWVILTAAQTLTFNLFSFSYFDCCTLLLVHTHAWYVCVSAFVCHSICVEIITTLWSHFPPPTLHLFPKWIFSHQINEHNRQVSVGTLPKWDFITQSRGSNGWKIPSLWFFSKNVLNS